VVIPGKLSTALLTVLALAVAVAVPLLTTTSGAQPLTNVTCAGILNQTCISSSPVNPEELAAGREDCDATAVAQGFEHGVFRPRTRQDCFFKNFCFEGERPYVCVGVPPSNGLIP
jgi:hypothetical protein